MSLATQEPQTRARTMLEQKPLTCFQSPILNGEAEEPAFSVPKNGPPTREFLGYLHEKSLAFETASPETVLAWAVQKFGRGFTMATGLGPEGCVIISMLAKIDPSVYIFNLDTGYQFAETLELRSQIQKKYGIVVDLQRPDSTVEEYETANGGPVYSHDPDRCCFDRKIRVLQRVASHHTAWATGVRRDQSPTRADTPIIKWDQKFSMVKISPLATWTKKDVWKRILDEDVPYNPLHDQGYPSIGCQPCTRAVHAGEDERAGRWSGRAKTECGLHV